jgi:hypothetical protein
MNRKYENKTYTTVFVADRKGGWSGLELIREAKGKRETAARFLFWDATGQFWLETFGDLPLSLVEQLIAEGKQAVETQGA